MKKVIWIALLILVFILPVSVVNAEDTGWEVEKFHSDITIHKDTSVTVTETIVANFGNLQKHGIYRDIPVKYSTRFGNNLDIRFKLLSITDEKGREYLAETSYKGDNVSLKIGDPDKVISGVQTYLITYQVSRVITRPNAKAELYWNITGNDWPVQLNEVSANITNSSGLIDRSICFVGKFGEAGTDCDSMIDDRIALITTSQLYPGEGLTFAIEMDQTSFEFPSTYQQIVWFVEDNWIYGLPLVVFLIMIRRYWLLGRDKQYINVFHESDVVRTVPLFSKVNALTTFHPPDDITPGEVGVIVDEKVHLRDITASIISLAVQGYIKIKEESKGKIFKKTEFTMILQEKDESTLKSYEKSILDMIFGMSRQKVTTLSKLPKDAYKYLSEVENNLYKETVNLGYFSNNPKSVRTTYLVIGVVFLFVGLFSISFFAAFTGTASYMLSIVISGLIIIGFSFFMPARTAKGRKALAEVIGLREYVGIGDWRQK